VAKEAPPREREREREREAREAYKKTKKQKN